MKIGNYDGCSRPKELSCGDMYIIAENDLKIEELS